MHITVNAQDMDIVEGTNLLKLLELENLKPDTVVVERNGQIVPSSAFEQTRLEHNDILEIFHFVGGG